LIDEVEKVKLLPVASQPEPKKIPDLGSKPEKEVTAKPIIPQPSLQKEQAPAIPDYTFCDSISIGPDLLYVPEPELMQAITKIVTTEAPIHIEELFQRIKILANIPRFNKKFRDRIEYACRVGDARGAFRIRKPFIWPTVTPETVLRRRKPDHGMDIDWICDEEINQAINYILHQQYATTKDDLIFSTLKIFGLSRRTDKAVARITKAIDSKLKSTELEVRKDGMIDFKK
jgi:hypothetical protein